jgi:hypothetical protein
MIARGSEKRRIQDCEIPLAIADCQAGVSTSAISRMIVKPDAEALSSCL